ncbi:MAG: AzlD domain-containing protein [Chloroflexota bacterium]|nr:AzlD domain-containing protein [Chloroflexota bacterium]
MNIWLLIVIVGVLTFLIRYSFIALVGRVGMPARLQRALRFVPAAVLAALIMPELIYRNGVFSPIRLAAGTVAILVAWRTKNAIFTMTAGMIVLWILQGMTGA